MKKVVATGKTIDDAIRNALQRLQATVEQVNVTVLRQPSRGLFGFIGSRDAEVEVELLKQTEDTVKSTGSSELSNGETPISSESVHLVNSNVSVSFDGAEAATLEEFPLPDTTGKNQSIPAVPTSNAVDAVQHAYQFLQQIVEAMGLKDVTIEMTKEDDPIEFQILGADIGVLIGKHGHTLDSLQYLVNLVANKHSDKYIRIVIDAEGYRLRRRESLERLADRLADQAIRKRSEVALEPMSAAERKIIHSRLQDRRDVKTQSRGEEPFRKIVIIPNQRKYSDMSDRAKLKAGTNA